MAKFNTSDTLNQILADCISICKDNQIPIANSVCPQVKLVKMRSKFADCCGARCAQNDTNYSFLIRFSSLFLENGKENEFIETMLHELLHTCNGCMNHGTLWKSYADILNKKYNLHIQRCGGHEHAAAAMMADKPIKVVKVIKLRCTGCGCEWVRHRNSRLTIHPELYHCGVCNSPIELVN